jgi:hypothetical protein
VSGAIHRNIIDAGEFAQALEDIAGRLSESIMAFDR